MKVYFIGIGGIGISALAQYYLAKGYKVSGSDLESSEIIEALRKKGAKIFIGEHKSSNLKVQNARLPSLRSGEVGQARSPASSLPGEVGQARPPASSLPGEVGQAKPQLKTQNLKLPDIVIYSPAVQPNNPELKKAKKLQVSGYRLQVLSYPEALGDLTKKHFTIAVAGTHGKSTTTAMLAMILIKAGLDPTVIVGTKLREFGNSNFRLGKSKYLVIEACEYEESFLNYWPKIIVLTNIEREHLDYFRNLKNILKAFRKFVSRLPKNGVLVANKDDGNINRIMNYESGIKNKKYFSIKQKETKKLKKILKIPGEHNIYNALAALTAARALKIPDKISFEALSRYAGSWRRFEEQELKIGNRKLKIINDYAHHPTEIKATLRAAREKRAKKEIWCVFQPHQYKRTFYLFKDFVKVFSQALKENWIDKLIITDIYDVAGREDERIKKKISSQDLVKKIKTKQCNHKVIYISTIEKTEKYLKENLKGKEIVIIMGAGDIYKLIYQL